MDMGLASVIVGLTELAQTIVRYFKDMQDLPKPSADTNYAQYHVSGFIGFGAATGSLFPVEMVSFTPRGCQMLTLCRCHRPGIATGTLFVIQTMGFIICGFLIPAFRGFHRLGRWYRHTFSSHNGVFVSSPLPNTSVVSL
ncbi:uncharacterized protein EV420DRAFT_1539428, partial [Desarmillaria tabescens]